MTNRRPPGGPPQRPQAYYPDDGWLGPPPEHPRQPSRRPPPPRRTSPVLLGLIYGALGLMALVAGVVTFLVISPPTDLIRREIVARVKQTTGRDLIIGGPASFTFYPTIGLRVVDVSLSPPPGMDGAPFLTAKSFDVGVRLLPLLGQKIVVDRLVLNGPVFDLRVDRNGRKSWDMAALASPRSGERRAQAAGDGLVGLAQADTGTRVDFGAGFGGGMSSSSPSRSIKGLSLGDIRIIDGTVRYSDERSGAVQTVSAINAEVGLPALAHPLTADGDLVWQREKLNFNATLTTPEDVLAERPAKLALKVEGAPIAVSYDGSVTVREAVSAEGAINGKTASLRRMARWLGARLAPSPGFGPASIAGSLRVVGNDIRLTGSEFTLDGATASGDLGVRTGAARPYVTAELKVANLNLANYVADGTAAAEERSVPVDPVEMSPSGSSTPNAQPGAAPRSIEDLLEQDHSGPQVRGYTRRAGWSPERIDLTGLAAVNANAHLSVVALSYGDVKVDSANVTVALKDSVLETKLQDVKLYQGQGQGLVRLDARAPEAVLGTNFTLAGVAAEPLLKDSGGVNWLAGTGNVSLAVSGRGESQASIMSSLNGKANVQMLNGALVGFNIGGAMRDLQSGRIPSFATSPEEKTDFSSLTGSFVITNGIAQNQDLQLLSPLLRVGGAGAVNLPDRTIDYTLRPRLVASLQGQGGKQDMSGLEVPLHITGPWDEPQISPDIAGALNSPGAAEAVKEIGKQFKGKNAGEIVDGLFGKGKEGEPSKAEKFMDKFFGR